MILRAPDAARLQGVDSTQGNGTVVYDQSSNSALISKWQALLTEYTDLSQEPGKPVSRLVDRHIDLIDPNAVPPKP